VTREPEWEGGGEELLRAQAQLVRAEAKLLDFGRTAGAWLLGCIVALTGVVVISGLVGDVGLATSCLVTVSILAALVQKAWRRPRD
jgi:hypothetical protein